MDNESKTEELKKLLRAIIKDGKIIKKEIGKVIKEIKQDNKEEHTNNSQNM